MRKNAVVSLIVFGVIAAVVVASILILRNLNVRELLERLHGG